MFCRHNRLTSKCPICSRELEENLRAQAPVRHVTPRKTGASSTPRSRSGSSSSSPRSSSRLVTRKLARAADDGYRNPLVPGIKATADAERLAHAVTQAHERLEPPGPFTAIDETPDVEHATWLAFLFALAPELYEEIDETRPPYGAADGLPEAKQRTIAAYQGWVERHTTQEAAFTGEESWTPERRFGRVFERLALPGFTRAMRYDLLTALGAADIYPLEGDALHFVEGEDATTLAAKRALVSGDRMLLERRARELADASELPIAVFDRGLAVWGTPGEHVDLTADPHPGIAAALGIDS
jgi:hypothetical protein